MRAQDDELLLKHIQDIHKDSRFTCGSPRVTAELRLEYGLPVNIKRVARLMREAGIQGLYRRRRRGCTVRDPSGEAFPDLVNRDFTADAPNRLWLTDITEHPTNEGKVYCAAVLDVYSRLIVGWSIDDNMRKELVIDALGMAIIRRRSEIRPDDARMHSDHGGQYTSWAFGKRLRDSGLLGSMGSVGDCFDNAMQLELLDSKTWETREELTNAMSEWIECWYNPKRRHSSIEMHSPVTFEALHTGSDQTKIADPTPQVSVLRGNLAGAALNLA